MNEKTVWGIGYYCNYSGGFESICRQTTRRHIFLKAGKCIIPLCSARVYTELIIDEKVEKCSDCETLAKKYTEDEIVTAGIQNMMETLTAAESSQYEE